jgi:hypothetical protein
MGGIASCRWGGICPTRACGWRAHGLEKTRRPSKFCSCATARRCVSSPRPQCSDQLMPHPTGHVPFAAERSPHSASATCPRSPARGAALLPALQADDRAAQLRAAAGAGPALSAASTAASGGVSAAVGGSASGDVSAAELLGEAVAALSTSLQLLDAASESHEQVRGHSTRTRTIARAHPFVRACMLVHAQAPWCFGRATPGRPVAACRTSLTVAVATRLLTFPQAAPHLPCGSLRPAPAGPAAVGLRHLAPQRGRRHGAGAARCAHGHVCASVRPPAPRLCFHNGTQR